MATGEQTNDVAMSELTTANGEGSNESSVERIHGVPVTEYYYIGNGDGSGDEGVRDGDHDQRRLRPDNDWKRPEVTTT